MIKAEIYQDDKLIRSFFYHNYDFPEQVLKVVERYTIDEGFNLNGECTLRIYNPTK